MHADEIILLDNNFIECSEMITKSNFGVFEACPLISDIIYSKLEYVINKWNNRLMYTYKYYMCDGWMGLDSGVK